MRPWIVVGLAGLTVGCPQPDPTFSDSYDQVVSDLRSLQTTVADLQEQVGLLSTDLDASDQRVQELEALLAETSADQLSYIGALEAVVDVRTEPGTVVIRGSDVRISAGGETNRGNLLMGDVATGSSTGSHNVVMGTGHTWSTSGSVIVGSGHEVTGQAVLVSGEEHTVSGDFAAVLAGQGHTVAGARAATVSGTNHIVEVMSLGAVIVGGQDHVVEGSSVAGQAERNVLIGGSDSVASAASVESVLVGGNNNTTAGRTRCVGLATLALAVDAPDGARGGCVDDDQVTFATPSESL